MNKRTINHHPAAKGVRQNELGKKVTAKVTEASEKETNKATKHEIKVIELLLPTAFCATLKSVTLSIKQSINQSINQSATKQITLKIVTELWREWARASRLKWVENPGIIPEQSRDNAVKMLFTILPKVNAIICTSFWNGLRYAASLFIGQLLSSCTCTCPPNFLGLVSVCSCSI